MWTHEQIKSLFFFYKITRLFLLVAPLSLRPKQKFIILWEGEKQAPNPPLFVRCDGVSVPGNTESFRPLFQSRRQTQRIGRHVHLFLGRLLCLFIVWIKSYNVVICLIQEQPSKDAIPTWLKKKHIMDIKLK